jgi:peptidoglycan hydrolase-like protein with peptidoglycan-binding domain
VARRTLAERETLNGALGYPSARPFKSGLAGTLPRLPAEGRILKRGDFTVELDGRPAGILLYGARPAWRDFGPGMTAGADVRQLKENLRALGFLKSTTTLSASWDKATTAAVKRWQRHLHLKVTGRLPLGSVVFRPGPVRVGEHQAELGDGVGPGTPLFEATEDAQLITASLRADRRRLVKVDDPVRILLPGGASTTGKVRSVGAVAKASPDGSASTVDLVVALDDPAIAAGYDQATVSLEITTQLAQDVLAVPVTALVALRGGGYAVEVVRGGTTELVKVQTAMFADGYVEVSGAGLSAGDEVVANERHARPAALTRPRRDQDLPGQPPVEALA